MGFSTLSFMILLIYSVRRRKHIRSVLIRAHKEEEHHPIHVKYNRVNPLERIMNLLEEVAIGKLHDAVRHQRGRLIHKDIREARHFCISKILKRTLFINQIFVCEIYPPCNENISSPYQSYPSHPSSDT